MPADVKDILYSSIEEIGKEKIRTDIATNIESSRKYTKEILAKCIDKLGTGVDDEELAALCEALLHFMLTASVLPSERKVRLKDAELDIVIPSRKALDRSPEKSLVIQIVKENRENKIRQAESVQPHHNNIWLVSPRQLQTKCRNYHLGAGGLHCSQIISDIHAFLAEKGAGGLKLLHG